MNFVASPAKSFWKRAYQVYQAEVEELNQVHKAVEIEMEEIVAGKSKTHSFEDIKIVQRSS